MTDITLLCVAGDPADMGGAYGQAMGAAIKRNVTLYDTRFRRDAGLSEADIHRWGCVYRDTVRDYHPRIAAMLDGVAEGANMAVERIYALNARTELLYGAAHRDDSGCTSVAVLPQRTADHHTLLAQNWDWHPEQAEVTFLLSTTDERGHQVLTLTEAGMLAKSGLNSAGIGVCANLLASDLDRGGEGVPYHFILRATLEAGTMAEAIKAGADCERVSSGNLLLADGAGEAIDLEVYPGDFGYLLPQDGLLSHANHFISGAPLTDLRKAKSSLTLLRGPRIKKLLNRTMPKQGIDLADVEAALRDHYSYPGGICRHIDESVPPAEQFASVFSLSMDLTKQRLRIAPYPVCEHEPVIVDLDELGSRGSQTYTLKSASTREQPVNQCV